MIKDFVLQDYIKAIAGICLNDEQDLVKLGQVAAKLNVSTSAVSDMVKRLVKSGFVENMNYKGILLTDKGWSLGMQLIRHHRLWEIFLFQVLQCSWDELHEEAEQLEHAASVTLMNRLDAYMGYPPFDPHGNPIPDQHGVIQKSDDQVLVDCAINTSLIVSRFVGFDPTYIKRLVDQGVLLGSQILIKEKIDFDGSLLCLVKGSEVLITLKAAQNIYVKQ